MQYLGSLGLRQSLILNSLCNFHHQCRAQLQVLLAYRVVLECIPDAAKLVILTHLSYLILKLLKCLLYSVDIVLSRLLGLLLKRMQDVN